MGFTVDTYTQALQGMDMQAAVKMDTSLGYRGPWAERQKGGVFGTSMRRRRPESNRCSGFCRPVPKPLGHVASLRQEHGADEGIRTLDLLHGKQTL